MCAPLPLLRPPQLPTLRPLSPPGLPIRGHLAGGRPVTGVGEAVGEAAGGGVLVDADQAWLTRAGGLGHRAGPGGCHHVREDCWHLPHPQSWLGPHNCPLRRWCDPFPMLQLWLLRLPEGLSFARDPTASVGGWTQGQAQPGCRLTLPGLRYTHEVELLGQPPLLVLHGSWGRHTVPSP